MIESKTPFWYVYLLKWADGKTYTGCTSNLKQRMKQHNLGNVSFTKSKILS